MKKIMVIVCAVVFMVGNAAGLFAHDSNNTDKPMMGKESMMGKGMPGRGMGMGKNEMVTTQDGGVIVMAGNKLYKYDKDLNLIKETAIKMDMEGMQRMPPRDEREMPN